MDFNDIKVLICDNTAEYGIKLASELRKIGLYAYTRRRESDVIINSIAKDSPDVVVCDLTLKDTDAVTLMKKADSMAFAMPAFVIASEIDNSFIEKQVVENGASYFIIKPYEASELCSIVKSVVKRKPDCHCGDIEVVVTGIIQKFGIPAHIKGYHYLRTAILYAVADNSILDSITKELYPAVARSYNTTPSRVERAIRHAIDTAWNRVDAKTISSFFGYSIDPYKNRPTNSEFIAFITDKLRLEMKFAR